MSTDRGSIAQMILETTPLVRRTITAKLRRDGISQPLPQLQVLALLAERPRNLSELAELQGVTLASMSNTVSRLADEGLVSRRQLPEDRRQVILGLTPQGKAAREAARTKAEAMVNDLLAFLSSEEQNTLMAGLDVLRCVFERANKPRR